jgi:hypothetical protein
MNTQTTGKPMNSSISNAYKFAAILAVGCTILFMPALAHATFTCQIGFQDSTGLGLLDPGTVNYTGMKAGIMTPACTRSANTMPSPWACVDNNRANQLWYYELCNNTIWFYFDENTNTNYGHFHHPAEDPTIGTCYTQDSSGAFVFGRLSNGVCSSAGINPQYTARYVVGHQPDEWMRAVNRSNGSLFRPSQIFVRAGSAPVKVAFIDSNNTFWTYHNLSYLGGSGTWWTLNPTGTYGATAFVGDESTTGQEMAFDNLSMEVNQ